MSILKKLKFFIVEKKPFFWGKNLKKKLYFYRQLENWYNDGFWFVGKSGTKGVGKCCVEDGKGVPLFCK